jgi:hypothetical protein
MSTTTDAREALFTGKDDVVRFIYDRLLEALHCWVCQVYQRVPFPKHS